MSSLMERLLKRLLNADGRRERLDEKAEVREQEISDLDKRRQMLLRRQELTERLRRNANS